jgi:methylmalonyl-CoA mutase cobalamin-binding subunit
MTNISPAAQDIEFAVYRLGHRATRREIAAAALRAAADRVVPQRRKPMYADSWEEATWTAQQDTRDELLAIAAELEQFAIR